MINTIQPKDPNLLTSSFSTYVSIIEKIWKITVNYD